MFDSILSALGYVGDSLDKLGSREIRGALGGKPRELLSFIPFSDRIGITNPNDITTGRDLLHNAGLVDKSTTGWGPGIAGMATEAVLDPFTLLGGGKAASRSLGRIGKGAENLSRLRSMVNVERDAGKLTRLASERPGQLGFNRGNYVAAWGGDDILNEETNHALTNLATLSGDSSGLPMQSRIAASLQRSGLQKNSPLRMGLGNVMLESAGHAARKPGLGGMAEGAKFWLDPGNHTAYHGQFAGKSPAAAVAYHAAPGAALGGLSGAGAGMREDEDPVRGALLGGLAGAVGGGLLSHAAYSPGKIGATRAGENAAFSDYSHIPGAEEAKAIFDKHLQVLRHGEKLPFAERRAADDAFGDATWDATQSMDVRKLVGDARHRLETYGDPWANTDKQLADDFLARDSDLWGENAAYAKIPNNPDKQDRWARSAMGDYSQASRDESTPLGRLFSLAGSAGVDVLKPLSKEELVSRGYYTSTPEGDFLSSILPRVERNHIASYDPAQRIVIPNVGNNPDLWYDTDAMSKWVDGGSGYLQGNYKDRTAVHEIGHALHHKPFAEQHPYSPFFGVEPYEYFDSKTGQTSKAWPELAKRLGADVDPDAYWKWIKNAGEINKELNYGRSTYAAENPAEYIAEQFVNLSKDMADDGGQGWQLRNTMNEPLANLYEQLGGPMPPAAMLAKLRQYLSGENAAWDPRFDPFKRNQILSEMADALGPMYPENIRYAQDAITSDVSKWVEDQGGWDVRNILMHNIREGNGVHERVASELHPDAKKLGEGSEAIAYKDPVGLVTRISPTRTLGGTPAERLNLPEVLQPVRANIYGDPMDKGMMVEHLPLINTFMPPNTNAMYELSRQLSNSGNKQESRSLSDAISALRKQTKGVTEPFTDDIYRRYGGQFVPDDLVNNMSNMGWFRDSQGDMRLLTHDSGAIQRRDPWDWPNPYRLAQQDVPADISRTLQERNAPQLLRKGMARGAKLGLEGQGRRAVGNVLENALKSLDLRRTLEAMFDQYSQIPLARTGVDDDFGDRLLGAFT